MPVSSVAWSPDGKWLASGSGGYKAEGLLSGPELKVWNVHTGQEILTLKGHSEYIQSVAFSPDGKRLSTGGSDKTVKVWKVAD